MHALGRATVVLAGLSACALVGSIPAQGAWAAGHPAGGQTVRPDGAALAIFRVDVSRYPQVGLVVTAPGAAQALPGADFTVTVGHRTWHPSVRRLSRRDLELVLVPALDLGSAAMRAEQAAAARFLTGLPAGAQTAAVDPAMPGVLPGTLTGDPAPSVTQIASLVRAGPTLAAASLATALSAFTPGPRVRRTVVLVVSGNQSLSTAAAGFRRRLAASGTELYVLDAVPGGAAGYDALAAGSGGFAGRIRVPADWGAVFSSISRDLSDQYYLRFTDTGRLPGQVTVTVRTGAGMALGTADLPVSDPVAPPSAGTEPPPPGLPSDGDTPLLLLAVLLIVVGVGYGMGMLAASRRDPRPGVGRTSLPGGGQGPAGRALPRGRDDLFFVFMLPCLNEEKVIPRACDGSCRSPGTTSSSWSSTTARTTPPPRRSPASLGERVWLLSRKLPQARQGKGEALNAAIRYLSSSGHLAGREPDSVVVAVVDADGRLDPQSVGAVRPYFADPSIGAVQIGVRINNREHSRLARMQDMEFVIYTEVFQRGRRHLGSVGLGGNGQFMRLSAMRRWARRRGPAASPRTSTWACG